MNGTFSLTLHTVKNDRVYQFVIPLGAPYEDANAAALELAADVFKVKEQMIAQSEEQKLKEEMTNAKAEEAAG